MAETNPTDQWRCSYCGTPIVRTDKLVQVGDLTFCCPNCELAAERAELAPRFRRSGGFVLACLLCGTPIFFPEIMVQHGPNLYCCGNCAEVAHRQATGQPLSSLSRPADVAPTT